MGKPDQFFASDDHLVRLLVDHDRHPFGAAVTGINGRQNDRGVRDRFADHRFLIGRYVHVTGRTNLVSNRPVAAVAADVVKYFSARRLVMPDPFARFDFLRVGIDWHP